MKRTSMRSTEDLKHGFMLCKASDPAWPVLFATDTWCSLVGIPLDRAADRSLWDIFEVDPWSKVGTPCTVSPSLLTQEISCVASMSSSLQSTLHHVETSWQAQGSV